MSIFDKIKKSLGMKEESKSKGYVLGGNAQDSSVYEVVFEEKSLGLHVVEGPDGGSCVTVVTPGSPANRAGVLVNDKIVALEGTCENFVRLISPS